MIVVAIVLIFVSISTSLDRSPALYLLVSFSPDTFLMRTRYGDAAGNGNEVIDSPCN